MNIKLFDKPNQAGLACATLIASKINSKHGCVIGLATGSTPLDAYAELVCMYEAGMLDFSDVVSFNLDEYAGLHPNHKESYRSFMDKNLFSKINIKHENTHVPDGIGDAWMNYDEAIRNAGGIDIQLLGIGNNGHIGFNEPCDVFKDKTHKVDLSDSTVKANARFFDSENEVPRQAVTMGIGSIMRARTVVLIATGSGKAEAVRRMVKDDVSPALPASVLRYHSDAVILLDRAAAALL